MTPPPEEPSNRQQTSADAVNLLVARAREGDTRAFEELVRVYESYVYRICISLLHHPQDAEDAMQDTFLNAHQSLARFRGDAQFSTWLARIAMNEALQRLRKRRDTSSIDDFFENDEGWLPRQVEEWDATPEEWYSTEEMRKFVEEAVEALPLPYRTVFVLRDICGEKTQEIAEALGLKIPTVKSRLLRARLRVRESLNRKLRKRPVFRGKLFRARLLLRSLWDRYCRALGLKR